MASRSSPLSVTPSLCICCVSRCPMLTLNFVGMTPNDGLSYSCGWLRGGTVKTSWCEPSYQRIHASWRYRSDGITLLLQDWKRFKRSVLFYKTTKKLKDPIPEPSFQIQSRKCFLRVIDVWYSALAIYGSQNENQIARYIASARYIYFKRHNYGF